MTRYRVLAWRGIPAQVKAEGEGAHTVSVALDPWFMQHIDSVAMDEGLFGSDEYLSQWEWSEYREREGSAEEVAGAIAAELESEWASQREAAQPGEAS